MQRSSAKYRPNLAPVGVLPLGIIGAASLFAAALLFPADSSHAANGKTAAAGACDNGRAGITLPSGFCPTIFADNVVDERHLAVASNGVFYSSTRIARCYVT